MNKNPTYTDLQRNFPHLFSNQDALLQIVLDPQAIQTWETEKKAQLLAQGLPDYWANIGVVYDDPYILILRDLVRLPSQRLGAYIRILGAADLKGGRATVILPVYQHKVLILRQFRHSTRQWHWEVPRGFGEPNTSFVENARKEIMEEIGGEVSELIDLGPYHSNTGIEGGSAQLVLAKLKSIGAVEQDEGIKSYQLVTIEKLEEMIRDAEITDGFTIAVFTRARLRGLI